MPDETKLAEALFEAHRSILDNRDGGYLCDTAPGNVKAFIEAVIRDATAEYASRVEALEAALRPFAFETADVPEPAWDHEPAHAWNGSIFVMVGDVRRARAALARINAKPDAGGDGG